MHAKATELLPTRWSLLSRLKNWEDQDSWREFFNTYWQLIYSMGMRSGLSHAEAEEVVQEVVISVAKKMGEFKANSRRGSFKAWLLTLTRWRIKDQLRKRGNVPELHRASDDTARTATIDRIPDLERFETEWNSEWESQVLKSALDRVKQKVKPEMFQVFDLVANKGWPATKVARRLRINLARVYYSLYKVSAQVKKEIQRLEAHGI